MNCFVKIFGCSHSFHGPFSKEMDGIDDLKNLFKSKGYENIFIKNLAWSGNSNDRIIDKVYSEAEEDFDKNFDVFYIIQYSYINRLWLPNDIDMIFHSGMLDEKYGEWPPHIPSEMKTYLKNMYESFVACFYNDELYFSYLLKKIDMLKSHLLNKKINFIHFLWETTSSLEEMVKTKDEFKSLYLNNKIKPGDTYEKHIKKMNELELIEFDKNIFNFSKISFDKRLTNWHTFGGGNYDLHLTKEGNEYLRKILIKKINEKIQ